MPNARTISKIAAAARIGPPQLELTSDEPLSLREPDADRFIFDDGTDERLKAMIAAAIGTRTAADPWLLRTDALKFFGCRPGDIAIVDLSRQAQRGDIVCAQHYSINQMTADTIFRVFEQPWLVAATDDPAYRRPLLVDGTAVTIMGVVTDIIRVLT